MSPTIKKILIIFKILLILVVGLLIYSNSLNGPFVFDDAFFIVRNAAIKHLDRIDTIFLDNVTPLRFLPFLSFAVNFSIHHLDTTGYHYVNLAIHLINTLLVWWFILLTLRTPKIKKNKGLGMVYILPYTIALVFLCHPLATESVTYISQRFTSMVALFYILTMCFYAQYRLKKKWAYLTAAIVSAICAMFSKQTAITLPVILIVYELIFFESSKKQKWGIGGIFLLIALIIPAFYSFRVGDMLSISMRSGSHIGDQLTPLVYLTTQFRVVVTYLHLLVWPYPQNFLYDFPASQSLLEIDTLLCFLLLIGLIIFAFYIKGKNQLIAFGIFWFFITLCVESSVIVIGHVIFEHRTYLPSVGFFLCFFAFLVYSINNRIIHYTLIILIVGAFSVMTYQRNIVWNDRVTFWDDIIQKSPNLIRPYLNGGVAYLDNGDLEKAIDYYNKAITIDPEYEEAYNNRGVALMRQKKLEEAFTDFNKALALDEFYVNAYHNRGTLYAKVGKHELALVDLNRALELNPTHPESYNERGSALFFLGKPDEALEDFAKAVLYDPSNIKAYNNRGAVYNALGEYTIAIRDFKEVIKLNPHFAPAYYNISYAYFKTGEIKKAQINVQKAKDLGYNVHPGYLKDLYTGE